MKQWKRLAALSSAIVMAAATLTYFPSDTLQNIRWEISASADETSAATWTKTESDGLTWTLYEDGMLTISGTGAMKSYRNDDSPAVQKKDNVKKVVIEDGVTSIGSLAFFNCSSLTSITIPDSVTRIGNDTFSYCSNLTSIMIPDRVTSIGSSAFQNCSSLTSITLPDHVTSIGNFAFYNCSSLTSITIPDGVTSIGDYAFEYCSSLTSITIPDSVTSIGRTAFNGCSNLTSITIPNSVTSIGDYAFYDCSSLTVYLESGSTLTSNDLGVDESKIVSYWKEDNLTWTLDADGTLNISGTGAMKNYDSIDNLSPVYNNLNVKKIVIEDGVTSIGELAFYKCSSLTNITIPGNVESIGESAFYSCDNLMDVTLQDGVKSIGNAAFILCNNLTNIVLPNSVTSIGYFAFKDCTSLTSIKIPDSVTSIGSSAFENCSSLTSITIPDSVTVIAGSAFENCSSLTSITIPDSVTVIGRSAFANCSSLKTISLSCKSSLKKDDFGDQADLVSYTNQHLLTKTAAKAATCTEDGNKEYWTCEHCGKYFLSDDANPETAKAVEQSETILPASHKLTKVKEEKAPTCAEDGNKEYWTCEHCGKYFLSDDANPETAKAVEQSETILPASHKLTKVKEEKAPTCTEDGNKEYWTCEHCKKYFLSDDTNSETATAVELSETILPALNHKNAITSYGASKPTETAPGYSGDLYCPDCDTVLEKGYTYWNEDNLTWKLDADGTLTISGTGAMKDYNDDDNPSSASYWNSIVRKIVIEDGVTSIGDLAFYYCSSLTSITIPDSVTSIGNAAFESCRSLTSITIPDSVTIIGESAFFYCTSLTNITLSNNITNIGNEAFYSCSSLTSITIPDSVTSIGKDAFSYCSSLTSITIPDSVTSIGKSAFEKCTNLQTISLSCKSSLKKSDFGDQADLVSYTSHTLKKTEAKDATCTESGNKAYWTCEHCGKYFLSDDANPETAKAVEQSEFIISASHKLTKVEAKAPTCAEDGNKEYWTCEHCGKYFLSDDTNPETAKAVELSETVIPALKHKNAITSYGASKPTETAPGYSGDLYCPDCDTVLEKGYTYWNEGNLTWKLDADGTLTISGTEAMKNYDSKKNRNPVYNNSNVKKVVIEDGVTSIGNYAFTYCVSLTSITIPDSVTSIGYYAFFYCKSLTSITIPDSVTSIGNYAFFYCRNLTSITIPDSVTSIGNDAFSNCRSLTSITIPDSVTSIGNDAFYGCSSLQTISLSCKSSLKKSDFGGQANLVSYTSHILNKTEAKAATCTEDGNKEYWTCEHCGKYFLSDDTNPETAKAVEQSETIIPASHKLTKVDAKAVTCAENGNKEYWTCEHCGKYFLSDDTNPETAKAVEQAETVIPALKHKNAITSYGASKPTETAPGYSGDLYCPDCDTVFEKGYTYWNEGNLTWKLYEDGTLNISGTGAMKNYNYYNNPSPASQKKDSTKKVVIEDGVTSIGNSAFENCSSLTDITIPDSVTSIGNFAFRYCSSLTSITIPDSVTSIGGYAFSNCESLTSITIPDSVTSIGYSTFSYCSSLTSITIPNSVTSIGKDAFEKCTNLQTISLSCKSSLKKSDFGDQADLVSASHTLKKTEAKTATCSESGNKEYWTCEHCGKYFLSDDTNPETAKAVEQAETVIPASHKLTKVEAKDATCAENGNKEYWTCEHCGKYFLSDDTNPETAKAVEQAETVIPASHKLTKVEAKAATCTENGNKEYWTCEHCKKYFLSDDTNPATAKAVEQAETVIPASHKLTKVEAKAPTCTEDGNKEYWTCEHCKKYFLSDDTNPETAKAVELSETVIPASHKLTKVEAKDATYAENGNKAYWTCEHCKKYFLSDDTNPETAKAVEQAETVIPALVQIATTTTPIKCVYGQDMSKIDLRDYVKNTDVVGEVAVKVATDSTLPDGMKLDGSNLSGKPAKAYEDGKEVTFTFTAENGSTENLTLLFLVAKADPTVEVAVNGDSHTEGDLVSELKLILSENSTKGVVELVSEIKALVAGKNTFTWKFTPEDENNYHTVTGTVVVNAQTTTTTTTTTKATTTTTNATTTTKPSKTTTTKATTTTKPSKTTTTNATTTTKPSKTTTTNATTTTKPSKTTTTNATTTTKPSKTTTTKATTTNTAIPSYGDINLDGKVDIVDAIFLNKYLATLIQFSNVQVANADCCQDGVLNDQDTTALMQFIILLIDDLPVQPTEK